MSKPPEGVADSDVSHLGEMAGLCIQSIQLYSGTQVLADPPCGWLRASGPYVPNRFFPSPIFRGHFVLVGSPERSRRCQECDRRSASHHRLVGGMRDFAASDLPKFLRSIQESPTLDLVNDCSRFVITHFKILPTYLPFRARVKSENINHSKNYTSHMSSL